MAFRAIGRVARLSRAASLAKSAAPAAVVPASWTASEVLTQLSNSQSIPSLSSKATFQPLGWTQARGLQVSSSLLESFDVTVPSMGESVSEGTIANILKKPGDAVKEDDIIAQLETDKVTLDIKYQSKTPGVITALNIKAGDVVAVGAQVCTVELGAAAAAAAQAAAPPPPKPAAEAPKAAAPAPKAEAPKPAPQAAKPAPPPPAPAAAAPAAAPKAGKPERRVKMTRLRMRVAERLKGAQNSYAMLTTFNEVDMSTLINLRSTYKEAFAEKHGVKLGFMSAFIKAAAYALNEVPAVNAVIDGDEIVYRDYTDISIAVATPKGLVVPVLRSADKQSLADLEKNMNLLGKKARDGTISIDDMAGGTFTISNGGVFGSMLSTPIINPPQSAIMGMHNIVQRATVVNGKIEARPIMYIALTYDHRLIDGREAVTFLKRVKEVVEDPARILLDC